MPEPPRHAPGTHLDVLAHSNVEIPFDARQTGTKSADAALTKRDKDLKAKRKTNSKQGGFYAQQFAKKGGSKSKVLLLFGTILSAVLLLQFVGGGASKPYPRKVTGSTDTIVPSPAMQSNE
jgi:hypothetical protein